MKAESIQCDQCGAAMAISGYVGKYGNIPVTEHAWTLSSPIATCRKYFDLCSLGCVIAWCRHRQKLAAVGVAVAKPVAAAPIPAAAIAQDEPSGDGGFDVFWKAYPRKVAKPAALRSFKKVLASGITLDTLLAAITKQKKSQQWAKDNGQFIPHPATWLNQERWNDTMEATPTQSCIQGGLLPRHNGGNF